MPSAINYHGTGKGNDTRLPWCNLEDCTKWTSDTFMVGHSVDYASTVWEQKEDKILSTQTNVQQLPWPNMVASKYCKISRMRKTCTGPGINIAFKYQEIINDTYDQSSFSRSIMECSQLPPNITLASTMEVVRDSSAVRRLFALHAGAHRHIIPSRGQTVFAVSP